MATTEEMRAAVLAKYPGAVVEQDDYPRDDDFRVLLVLGSVSGNNWGEAEPRAWEDAYNNLRVDREDIHSPSPLPRGEKFTFWIDEDGDYIVKAQREKRSEYLSTHGATIEEAVLNMRKVLAMAVSLRSEGIRNETRNTH